MKSKSDNCVAKMTNVTKRSIFLTNKKGKTYNFLILAKILLIFIQFEAGHVLNLFLFSQIFEPQRSYKHGSYTTNSVYLKKKIGPNSISNVSDVCVDLNAMLTVKTD